MRTAFDPRHQKRREAIQALFAWGFQKRKPKDKLALEVVKKLPEIDKIISQCAPEWPPEQINKVDLAILRLAVFELAVTKQEPEKVIIDEAVELAKEFGSESSFSFVNGVLGTVLKKIQP